MEHLSKAQLASKHLALISADDFESLLHACGQEAHASRPSMRTINVTESLKRTGRFLPQVKNLEPELRILCDARNGVAHLAQLRTVDELRVPFLKACELIRDDVGVDRATYWGEFEGAVDAALEKSAHTARVRVETALGAARVDYKNRYGHLDDGARQALIRATEAGYKLDKYDQQVVDCPACSAGAVVSGAVETRWEQDDEYSGSLVATFFPGYLRCGVCDLELDGDDELRAAEIEEKWDIDVDPADFYEEWE